MSFNFSSQNQQQQQQFVGRRTNFSSMPDARKKDIMDFEKNVIKPSREAKAKVTELLDRITVQPDLTEPISKQIDNLRIMYQQMEYMHSEVNKFQEFIRKETSEAGRFESDVKRFGATSHFDLELPPNFYWTKYNSLIERRVDIEKTIKDLADHVQELDGTPSNPMEDTSSWSFTCAAVEQALQASNKVLLNIAETVRQVHTHMDTIRVDYRRYREEKFNDFRDPFDHKNGRSVPSPPRRMNASSSGRTGRLSTSPAQVVQHPSSIHGPNTSYVSRSLNKSFEAPGIHQIVLKPNSGFGSGGGFGSGSSATSSSSSSGFGSSSSGFGSSSGTSFGFGGGASNSGTTSSGSGFSFGGGSAPATSSGSSSGFGNSSSSFSFGTGAASSSGFSSGSFGAGSSGGFGSSPSGGFGSSSSGSSSGFSFGSSSATGSGGSGFSFGSQGSGPQASSALGTVNTGGFSFGSK